MEPLSPEELELIQNTQLLTVKARALAKINNLLSDTRVVLKTQIEDSSFIFPANTNLMSGKISIGENYLGLPYQVLDYPALFSKKDTFAFRTMFWWGNFFSSTLYLEGRSLERFRPVLISNFPKLCGQNIHIGVNSSPWHHHFGEDNYLPVENNEKILVGHPFIKLARKWDIDSYENLESNVAEYVERLLQLLAVNNK